ncbi:MAG TPA: Hsp70 family protein [Blastococcus sp.]|nr:Hsp70 family protein [Blastococcus sp.]
MTTHEPGSEIAGYRIESLIGRGGMAVVYRAEDMRLGRKVALKLLSPQLADSEQFRQRFIRESRLAASLDHPNIVPIYEAGEADGQLFIAMRYVLGYDLKGLLAQQGGRLPLDRTLRVFSQIGDALDSAHRAGLVHRDVKPGNILISTGEHQRHTQGDHVYLTDFGLTKRTSELTGGLTGTGHFLGTVDYVAPEQIQGKPVGPGTDIYALGCVLYECLTGQLPFRRDDDAALLWAHLVEIPPPVSGIRPEIPTAVNAVVARAMAKDPEARYETCEELLHELEAALEAPAPAPSQVAAAEETDETDEAADETDIQAEDQVEDQPEGQAEVHAEDQPDVRAPDRAEEVAGPAPVRAGGAGGYSLAIDLGTSFVAAAVADDRGLEMFALGDGSLVAPAAVYVRSDGRVVTGEAAARRAVSHPDRVARETKRNLGNPTPVMLGGAPYAVSGLLAALLQDVLVRVTERQGAKPEVVALTHPANWGPFRKQLFEDVARAAGLTEPLYTTEPEAAAAHYASTRPLGEGEVLAVYDLGGGTFDATVLRRTAQGFEILGTPEGIERLGGADFDDAIFAHVNYLAGGALGELDLSDARTLVSLARLRQDCTLAKEALSVDVEAVIPVFLPNRHFEVTLTRAELEDMIRAPIESTIGTLDRVLSAARVDRTRLAAVLLVGGSSRIPLVAQMVSEAFGRPTVVGAHPKHAVALGAALLAEDRRKGTTEAAAPARADALRRAEQSVAAGNGPAASPVPPASPAVPAPAAPGTPAPGAPRTAGAGGLTLLPVARGDGAGAANLVPAPRVGDSLGGTALPGDRGQLPPQQGSPPDAPFAARGDLPPEVPAPPPSTRRRNRWVALGVGLLLLVAAGVGLLVYLNLQPAAPQHQASASGPAAASGSHPASAPPTATAVAPAVPIPSLGPVLQVGQTPNFVVASPSGRQLYIASRDAGLVTVVDTAVNKVTGTIPITAGPPQFLAFSKDGRRVYVSVWNAARTIAAVSVLDTTNNSIIDTIQVHTRPFLAAVSPDGKRVYVPNHDTGTVSVIDATTDKVASEFTVPANPHSIAFTPNGSRVYIADHESNVVSVVDTATDKLVTTIPVPSSPHNVAVHPTRPLAIVASFGAGSVSAIDTNTNKVIRTIPVGANPQHVAWSADGRFAYITNDASNTVSVIDATTLTVTATIPTGHSPTSMAVLPNGKVGYVSNLDDGTLTVLNLGG